MYISTSPAPGEFAGRRALVTGGSRGIGAAVARRLVSGGATVVTSARGPHDETPEESTFIRADIRTADGARRLVEAALETLGGLDILVNSAGAARAHFGGIPDEEWDDSLSVNFLSAVRVTDAALPALREAGRASVVNVSSAVAADPPAPLLHYGAAKAALDKGLATSLAPAGIRVNTLTLGMVETPGGSELLQSVAEAMGGSAEQAYKTVPLGRGGDPRDAAEAVAFLVSDRAQWIAGAYLDANGRGLIPVPGHAPAGPAGACRACLGVHPGHPRSRPLHGARNRATDASRTVIRLMHRAGPPRKAGAAYPVRNGASRAPSPSTRPPPGAARLLRARESYLRELVLSPVLRPGRTSPAGRR